MSYQVLARKYRPETFTDLVGQDAMVRTLKNAFASGRIAQAFIMTGIRGTGKTTTARIIAKGMNCIGADGNGEPTTQPCGTCEHCQAIIEGRHMDVMEMDAASRTGVNDIREIIDTVAYKSATARYKIYIIDEVHMLSSNAFNALLKTLEEPPPHVKFIFATTEIRKVPVTVLSRCQRFDLRRIEPDIMLKMLKRIANAEAAQISDEALGLITRASEGSARDATSLLDQAISHGEGETTADHVRHMMGLADRGRILDLMEMILNGETANALTELKSQYVDGVDPIAVLRDLAEMTNWLSVIKITPDAANNPTISPDERVRGQELSNSLNMRILTRMWQMLLKALEEVSIAPNTMTAAEMAIIRLTYVADLPTPEELMKKLADPSSSHVTKSGHSSKVAGSKSETVTSPQANTSVAPILQSSGQSASLAVEHSPALVRFPDFNSVVELIRANRDAKLLMDVEKGVKLVSYQPGRVEFEPSETATSDLAQRLGTELQRWTGCRWAIIVVKEGGGLTIDDIRNQERHALEKQANQHKLLKATYAAFPNAKITSIRTHEQLKKEAQIDALQEAAEELNVFEED